MKTPRSRTKKAGAATVGVAELKTHCLSLIEEVRERGAEYVITKRGEPVAKLVPIGASSATLRGALKGEIEFVGEVVHTDWSDEFDALRE